MSTRQDGLLKPGTPINSNTINLALENMALACARGPVQRAAVFELICDGMLESHLQKTPVTSGQGYTIMDIPVFGEARLQYKSWKNLKARLERGGFTFEQTRSREVGKSSGTQTFRMYWGLAQ